MFSPMLRAARVFLFCGLILAILAAGCSTTFPPLKKGGKGGFKLPPSSYIQDVPFYPGVEYQCGPSVIASVLNYLGYDIKPEDISKEIYLKNVRGTLNIDMASFARRFGDVTVKEFQGDLTLLKESLSLGYPLIVFVDLGIWSIRKGHYMLVVGYDDSRKEVIVYSGAEKDKVIGYKEFMRIWKRGGYWTFRITN